MAIFPRVKLIFKRDDNDRWPDSLGHCPLFYIASHYAFVRERRWTIESGDTNSGNFLLSAMTWGQSQHGAFGHIVRSVHCDCVHQHGPVTFNGQWWCRRLCLITGQTSTTSDHLTFSCQMWRVGARTVSVVRGMAGLLRDKAIFKVFSL